MSIQAHGHGQRTAEPGQGRTSASRSCGEQVADLPLSSEGAAASVRPVESAEEPQRLPDGPLHPGEVIRALARAARCFLTYDARNQIVGRFIANYREAVDRSLQTHGALTFQIAPFDILWQNEAIYHEEDRERSLAFRLFRDGVRGMTLQPGVAWEELLRLLEILSVRYTRIRMHEEDTLTLPDARFHVPSLFGRLLRIAEDYDNLCGARGGLTPPAALGGMTSGAGTMYDPVLLQVTINRLGRYPSGTRVEITGGRTGRCLGLARPGHFEHPRVVVAGGQLVDVAEGGRVVRVLED